MRATVRPRSPFAALPLAILLAAGCYADNEEDLYPSGACNTTGATYSGTVRGIIADNCATAGCHTATVPAGGISLTDHAGLLAIVQDGRLIPSINHTGAVAPMPLGATKLPQCSIDQIEAWIADGAAND